MRVHTENRSIPQMRYIQVQPGPVVDHGVTVDVETGGLWEDGSSFMFHYRGGGVLSGSSIFFERSYVSRYSRHPLSCTRNKKKMFCVSCAPPRAMYAKDSSSIGRDSLQSPLPWGGADRFHGHKLWTMLIDVLSRGIPSQLSRCRSSRRVHLRV